MSWPFVELKSVARVVGGATPKSGEESYWGGDVAWVTPRDLSNLDGKEISDTPRKLTAAGLKSCSSETLPVGSVLFSSRAPIGHVAMNTIPMATNQGFKSFIPGKCLEASYLYWWLRCHRARLEQLGNGATFKEVSKAVVERIRIPLPPLQEQRRIAAILDKADAVRRKRREALSRLADLGQAIFYEMFGDPATNPKHWPMGKIGDLLAEVKYGTATKANEAGLGIPILRMGNLTYDGRIDVSDLKHVELPAQDFEKYTTKRRDILFNRTNSKDLVGKTAVVSIDEPMAIAGYLVRSRVNAAGNPYYISAYLNSSHGKTVLKNMCKRLTQK